MLYLKKLSVLVVVLFLIFSCSKLVGQEQIIIPEGDKIDEIKKNSQKYLNEVVTIVGFITQYVPSGTTTTKCYLIKDSWGGIIKVITSRDLPEIGIRYIIRGQVNINPTISPPELYITEGSRTEVGGIVTPQDRRLYWLIGSVAFVFVLLVIVLVWILRGRAPAERVEKPIAEELPEPVEVRGDTIKIHVPPAGTLKLLPGRFKVLSGDETLKEIRFYRTKDQDEIEMTFGRAPGKPYSHVQLKPMTVSAKQAKLVFTGGKYTLINYAKTASNPTKVNDVELEVNGAKVLEEGDIIEMGEMVFRFESK